jgi:hypothetical protein
MRMQNRMGAPASLQVPLQVAPRLLTAAHLNPRSDTFNSVAALHIQRDNVTSQRS